MRGCGCVVLSLYRSAAVINVRSGLVGFEDAAVGDVGALDLVEPDADRLPLGLEDVDGRLGDRRHELATLVKCAAGQQFHGDVGHGPLRLTNPNARTSSRTTEQRSSPWNNLR